jgi:hypothetical protein
MRVKRRLLKELQFTVSPSGFSLDRGIFSIQNMYNDLADQICPEHIIRVFSTPALLSLSNALRYPHLHSSTSASRYLKTQMTGRWWE